MRISNNILLNPYVNPKFKSASGFYRRDNNKEMGFYTWFFRGDLSWKEFTDYEINHFKDKEKVNIVQFAASDGSEAYSQIISLLENPQKENVEKFFPIEAYDIKESLVKLASSGMININHSERMDISSYTDSLGKYFTEVEPSPCYMDNTSQVLSKIYTVNPDLRKKVNFSLADMFERLPRIEDNSNTIILCRNCLGYFYKNEVQDFIKTAGEVLKKGSLFVLGRLEEDEPYIEHAFSINSFKQVIKNVYQKL